MDYKVNKDEEELKKTRINLMIYQQCYCGKRFFNIIDMFL